MKQNITHALDREVPLAAQQDPRVNCKQQGAADLSFYPFQQ